MRCFDEARHHVEVTEPAGYHYNKICEEIYRLFVVINFWSVILLPSSWNPIVQMWEKIFSKMVIFSWHNKHCTWEFNFKFMRNFFFEKPFQRYVSSQFAIICITIVFMIETYAGDIIKWYRNMYFWLQIQHNAPWSDTQQHFEKKKRSLTFVEVDTRSYWRSCCQTSTRCPHMFSRDLCRCISMVISDQLPSLKRKMIREDGSINGCC